MDKTFCVVVQNRIKEGYRRAGFSFHLGDNSLATVSASQLAQLKADPRLVVQITETGSQDGGEGLSKEPAGGDEQKQLRTDPPPADLNSFTVEQLKAQLTEKGIAFKQSATKAELIALFAPADGEKSEA
nr:MAG TPA: hypothetical protein [Caudoviricetes sp.]